MRTALQVASLWLLVGCAAKPYAPSDPGQASFLARSVSQTAGSVTVIAAVPDAAETTALFGLPLYDQGVQPVWLEIRNDGPTDSRLAIWSLDPDYLSPMEVAWMNRSSFSSSRNARMERWFYETAMDRRVPAGESRSGFVYTTRVTGTKGFNVDVFTGDMVNQFTFFVPIPGHTPDYRLVDFDDLYAPEELIRIAEGDLPVIREALESLPCCSSDAAGTGAGDPFNVLLVGSRVAVRRMLLRAAWRETEAEEATRTIGYQHRYRGRPPDGMFTQSRADGSERRELRLWLSPYRYGSEWVWLGQASYDLSDTTGDPADYVSDPDRDRARNYLLQNVWYSQSLARAGFADGVPVATREAPRQTFTGATFFTDGLRIVLFLSEVPIAVGDAEIIPWMRLRQ